MNAGEMIGGVGERLGVKDKDAPPKTPEQKDRFRRLVRAGLVGAGALALAAGGVMGINKFHESQQANRQAEVTQDLDEQQIAHGDIKAHSGFFSTNIDSVTVELIRPDDDCHLTVNYGRKGFMLEAVNSIDGQPIRIDGADSSTLIIPASADGAAKMLEHCVK